MLLRAAPAGGGGGPPEAVDEYRLLHILGAGAMGRVYLAEDTLLERRVAIKFIQPRSRSPAARARFFAEARAIARLSHPNVVAVHRVGEVQGQPYLVSEYVEGTVLDALDLPLPWERALRYGIDLARGLAAAHRGGVLHRDVKPANAIVALDDTVKLLDFGLAELLPSADRGQPGARAEGSAGEGSAGEGSADPNATVSLPAPSQPGPGGADAFAATAPADAPAPPDVLAAPHPFAGTPLYGAPELFAGGAATTRSDVYALGVVLFQLTAGRTPHDGAGFLALAEAVQKTRAPRLAAEVPGVDARFAAVVDRCLEPDPAARPASGEVVREALEQLVAARAEPAALPEGNPYRGLLPFEAAHRGLFFGRGADVCAILERLASQPFTLVMGDSGVGKSSLCRAGVLPAVLERGADARTFVPGRRPIEALAAALAPVVDRDEAALAAALRDDPAALGRELRRRDARAVLFADQLEELCTLAPPEEAACASAALRALVDPPGPLRLLAAARSDFLGRLAALPGFGDDLISSLYLLRPLSPEGVREAVTGPARAKGVTFEDEALVDALVAEAQQAPGGLALLEFALAELWDARDQATRTIPATALAAIGGVGGALARHADAVLAALGPADHAAARAVLLDLVTAEGTRATLSERELTAHAGGAARTALEALVHGRLLVARSDPGGESVYEIAHEALLRGWDTLLSWLGRDAETRAAAQRLGRAAREWDRLGRGPEALWGDRQLEETRVLDPDTLGPVEAAFLSASRRAARRRRAAPWAGAAVVLLASVAVVGGVRLQAARATARQIHERLAEADAALAGARSESAEEERLRREAFTRFDAGEDAEGEARWDEARGHGARAADRYARACQALEVGLLLARGSADLRRRLAEALEERAAESERAGRLAERDELTARIPTYDEEGEQRRRREARLTVTTSPPGAEVSLARYDALDGRLALGPWEALGAAPVPERRLAPGSIVLRFEMPGRAPVRLPLLLRRGAVEAFDVALPSVTTVPEGFVYVPAGVFLYGSPESDEDRRSSERQPLHPVRTGAYLVAVHEVTFADYIAYLRALSPGERAARTPRLRESFHAVELTAEPNGRYRLLLRPNKQEYSALEGEPIRYPGRNRRQTADWLRMPVAVLAYPEALAYAAWLGAAGGVPGARLCTGQEWERAARGADGRVFPHGDRLDPDDADVDVTYGRDPLGFGPDEVGAHPASRSPFGIDDMAGNVWEWTAPRAPGELPTAHGGSFYQVATDARAFNFEKFEPTMRSALIGLRICATPRPDP